MKNKNYLLILVCFLFSLAMKAQIIENASLNGSKFSEGLELYKKNDFEGSEKIWTELIKQGPFNLSVLFNRALSLAGQKKWGSALAVIRDLQELDPRNPDYSMAIKYIEVQTGGQREPRDISFLSDYERIVGKYYLLPEVLTAHFAISILFALLLIFYFRENKLLSKAGLNSKIFSKLHWLMSVFWVLASILLIFKVISTSLPRATVVHTGLTALRSGPVQEAPEVVEVSEGALVFVHSQFGDWVQVNMEGSPRGWISKKDLQFSDQM